jgi:hypothetical protein
MIKETKGGNLESPTRYHTKPDMVPDYAVCPHHGADSIYFNNTTRFYQCIASVEPGEPGFNPRCKMNDQTICVFKAWPQQVKT